MEFRDPLGKSAAPYIVSTHDESPGQGLPIPGRL
jgi:hypothetical protein